MLPKFRPARLGDNAPARPSIRLARPSPPPPPPAPPRRRVSGIVAPNKGNAALAQFEVFADDEPSTDAYPDPPTQAVPRVRANVMRLQASSNRGPALELSFEDETQARPVDDDLLARSRSEAAPADLSVAYESLPSLEVRQPFDTYETQLAEPDPETRLFDEEARRDALSREGSGPRPTPRSYAAPVPAYDDSSDPGWSSSFEVIPPAPGVPHDLEPEPPFIMGVQPLAGPAQPFAPAPSAPAPHFPAPPRTAPLPQAAPSYPPSYPRAYAPPATPPPQAVIPTAPRQMVGPMVQNAPVRVSRFVWFVIGAAFGIAFAFFATGYFGPRPAPTKAMFPPPAPLPAHVAAAPTTQLARTPAPVSTPVAALPAARATAPAPAAVKAPAKPVKAVAAKAKEEPAPRHSSKAHHTRRRHASRAHSKHAHHASAHHAKAKKPKAEEAPPGPKPLYTGDTPNARPAPAGGDIGDLLSAALNP